MELDAHTRETTLLLNPTPTQFDKEFFLKRDNAMNANFSQTSENNDDNSLTSGRIKTESGTNEPESLKAAPKGNTKKIQLGKKWDWLPCHYELKREEQGTEIYWNLNPIIQLVNPDSKAAPQIDISIDMERPFMYNSEVGWNWHKSWNLPNITVNAKIFEPKTKIPLLPPADLKAQLFAVKVLLNRVEQVKLLDLSLKGSTPQDLSEGNCTFNGVKFSSTSYNNDGVKFHLVLLVCIQDDARNRLCPKILYSRISPPIFVDSRKAARNSHVFKSKKINSVYFSSFPPDTFNRSFVKRNNKLTDSKEEIIENNLEGLSHYFTAPNIRNKVKHPLFLAFKFSNCVKLFYNVDLIKQITEKDELNEETLVYAMQKVFLENHHNKKEKGDFSNISNKAFDNKYFILVIEEPENSDSFLLNKRIGDYLEPIINDVLHIIFNSNLLPSHFSLFPMKNIASSYSATYPRLMSLKESYGESLDEDNDDFEDEKNSDDENYKNELNAKRKRSEMASDIDELDDEGPKAAKGSAIKKKVKTEKKKKPKPVITPHFEENPVHEESPLKEKKSKDTSTTKKKGKKSETKAKKDTKKSKASAKIETQPFDQASPVNMKMESGYVIPKDEENSYMETSSIGVTSSMPIQTKMEMEMSDCFGLLKREVKAEPMDSLQNFAGGLPSNMNMFMGMQHQQQQQHQQSQNLSQEQQLQELREQILQRPQPQNHLLTRMYEQLRKDPKSLPELPNTNQKQQQNLDPRQQFLELQIMKRQQQLIHLQTKLKEMQEKANIHKKDKPASQEKQIETKPAHSDMKNLSPIKTQNQSFANQIYFKNAQFPNGNMMENNMPIGHHLPQNYVRFPYPPGLQMGGQGKNQPGIPATFFNYQQEGNLANNKGMFPGTK